MSDQQPLDAVERKHAFTKDHPDVRFSVEPGLVHRAEWTNPDTGECESASFIWLGQLIDKLERKFGP